MKRKIRNANFKLNSHFLTFIFSHFLVFSLSLIPVTAQLKKANDYFAHFEYAKAIPYYVKELHTKDSAEALDKLAACYFFTGDYEKAEIVYRKIISQKNSAPINLFNYGRILQYNRKYAEAKNQFLQYAIANPQDKRGEIFAKSCDIRFWKDSLFGVEIKNLANINTGFSEFSPVLFDKQLFFVSDRPKNFIEYDKQNWTSTPFSAVYSYREKAGDTAKFSIHLFENFNGHDGPVSFSEKKKQIFFMRIEPKKITEENKINKGKIFEAGFDNEKISGITPFPYNSDMYSCGHPAITPDGEYLFFTSDMPGGFGGKDIYYCKRENGSWGKPVNLGSEINTEGDEVFPSVKNDSFIYFSSNGHANYGGLDIFSAYKKNGEWKISNLKMPVNSNADDYGIFFSSENKGCFSSNRKGGKGQEDIYEFKIISSSITGEIFSLDNKPRKGMTLYLMDALGAAIDSIITNDAGFFIFKKLQHDQNYVIKMKTEDVEFHGHANMDTDPEKIIKIYVANKRNKIVDTVYTDNESFFRTHRNKTVPINIRGKIQLSALPGMNAPNIGVLLKTEDGKIISSTITDKDGFYDFKNLKGDESYMIVLDETNPSFDNKLKYTIMGNIFSNGLPILAGDVQLWFGDKFDEKIISMVLDKDGLYRFEYLPTEHYAMKLMDTQWGKIDLEHKEDSAIIVIENIYYEVDKWEILEDGKKTLNKAISFLSAHPNISMELGAHTDSRASDKHNLELSQKRAQAAVDYMASKGIKTEQLKAIGYGEAKPINKCINGTPCTEEEYRINRRTEFKIIGN